MTLIIAAVPGSYLKSFQDSIYGYHKAHPGEMLEALIRRYGQITRQELKANRERLHAPWNPDTPIVELFANAMDCRNFARDGGDPILDAQFIDAITDTIKTSGALATAIHAWERKPVDEQTIEHLEDYFTREDVLRRVDNDSLKSGLTANVATTGAARHHPQLQLQYCWSHGGGGHSSDTCAQPKTGHVRIANFDNWAEHGGAHWLQRPASYKRVIELPDFTDNHRPSKRKKPQAEAKTRK